MIILAIETSCDESAVSLVEAHGDLAGPQYKVLAHQVASQIKLHQEFGGVVPSLAKREHQLNLVPVLIKALTEAELLTARSSPLALPPEATGLLHREPELLQIITDQLLTIEIPPIDLIAVTNGPGLEPALWVGVNFGKALATLWQKPLLPVNHMEGHIAAALLRNEAVELPALALLVSGGHTELIHIKEAWHYEKIGQTKDDAVGEAFDKVGRLLGLPYPGGYHITELAKTASELPEPSGDFKFPRPMIHSTDFDFSFSGLKTAVLYSIKKLPGLTLELKAQIAYEFQEAALDVLVAKTIKAAEKYDVRSIVIGGGVAANPHLEPRLKAAAAKANLAATVINPHLNFTTDNATMIAAAAYLHHHNATPASDALFNADGNLSL